MMHYVRSLAWCIQLPPLERKQYAMLVQLRSLTIDSSDDAEQWIRGNVMHRPSSLMSSVSILHC